MRRKKKHARPFAQKPQPGQVEDLSEARQRRKRQRFHRLLLWVLPLTLLFVWFVARNSAALVSVADFVETMQVGTMQGPGLPQDVGISELYQWYEMNGGFVALGQENCVFYNNKGVRMRSIQAGYARPAISAGDTRFVLYNRGGTELRVESRTQNLYTRSYTNGIMLCEMGPSGSLAVVTEDPSYTAQVLVYPSSMEQPLTWKITSNTGVPIRVAFSKNEKKLAIVTLSAENGKTVSQIYVLDRGRPKEQPTLLATKEDSVPLAADWVGDRLMVTYNDGVCTYQEKKGETARFDAEGVTDISLLPNGRSAVLLNRGTESEIVLLNKNLKEQQRIQGEKGRGVVLSKTSVYVYTDTTVTCYTLDGAYAWHVVCNLRPQSLLRTKKGLLMFQGGEVQVCTGPKLE